MSILARPYFRDEEAAHAFLESILWPDGTTCPHCGVIGKAYKITPSPAKRVRYGLWRCRDCRKQFTCKVGTVFEHARIPLHEALQAAYLLCSSKKGVSSNQLARALEISLKAAWFLSHRIREAMRELHFADQLGGEGKIVEADETYVGGKERNKHRSKRNAQNIGGVGKQMVFSLVERGGKVRSMHLPSVSANNLRPVLKAQIDAEKTRLMTMTKTNKIRVGGAAFRYAKGKLLPAEVANWQSAFMLGYLHQTGTEPGAEAKGKLCLTIDAAGGVCHPAPTDAVSRFNNMEAACATISEWWPNITAPDGAVF